MRIGEAVEGCPRFLDQVQLTPLHILIGSDGFGLGSFASETVLARDWDGLLQHHLLVRERIAGNIHEPAGDGVEAATQILPCASLRNTLLRGFPFRASRFERWVLF